MSRDISEAECTPYAATLDDSTCTYATEAYRAHSVGKSYIDYRIIKLSIPIENRFLHFAFSESTRDIIIRDMYTIHYSIKHFVGKYTLLIKKDLREIFIESTTRIVFTLRLREKSRLAINTSIIDALSVSRIYPINTLVHSQIVFDKMYSVRILFPFY